MSLGSNGYAWEMTSRGFIVVSRERGSALASGSPANVIDAAPRVNMTLPPRRLKYRPGINFSPTHLNAK